MKRVSFVVLVSCVFLCLLPKAGFAQQLKIGYVDGSKILSEYREAVEADSILQKENRAWRKKAEDMQLEISKMEEEIQSQSLMLTPDKLSEKKLARDKRYKEYQDFVASNMDPQTGLMAKRYKELMQPVYEKINAVITQVAVAEGYTYVLDNAQGFIVYAPPNKEYDLTAKVLEKLGSQTGTTDRNP